MYKIARPPITTLKSGFAVRAESSELSFVGWRAQHRHMIHFHGIALDRYTHEPHRIPGTKSWTQFLHTQSLPLRTDIHYHSYFIHGWPWGHHIISV